MGSPVRKWYHWYSPSDTPAERKLLLKLDFLVVVYSFIALWVKYIDQTNINNSYVSGMTEDLHFHGNQLVQFQTVFVAANVIGLIPFLYLFPKTPMYWLIPALEFGWGIFTLIQFKAKTYSQFMALRFIIGLFEAPFYSGIHYVIGSWYRGDELARRGGFFHSALSLGTLTAGLLQAAASKHLNKVDGLAGWRWNFIITAVFPLVLGPVGFFIFPGTPDKPNLRVLSQADITLARSRFTKSGGEVKPLPLSIPLLKRIFSKKQIYILVAWFTIGFLVAGASGSFLLWLKSLHRFSTPALNNLSTIQPLVSIIGLWILTFGADMIWGRTASLVFVCLLNLSSLIILDIWNVTESAKWYAFTVGTVVQTVTPLIYSWVNSLNRGNTEERAITLVLMQIIATSTNAWIPLLVWPTVQAPRYPRGFPYATGFTVLMIIVGISVRIIYSKEATRVDDESNGLGQEDVESVESGTESPAIDGEKSLHVEQRAV